MVLGIVIVCSLITLGIVKTLECFAIGLGISWFLTKNPKKEKKEGKND